MHDKIPVSVIITTLNEEKNLPRCLGALKDFDEIIVVDSHSTDRSREIVEEFSAHYVEFEWNGQYPKKRQWCLDNLSIKNDYVFFVDADEEVTEDLVKEIKNLDWKRAGYFIDGLYVHDGRALIFGMRNHKLCLINRHKMEFPVVDDLDIAGMGEIEGHYQPVLKMNAKKEKIGRLKTFLLHHAFEDEDRWKKRHEGYALWERGMISKDAYPKDPLKHREIVKKMFRSIPFKDVVTFVYFGLLRGGLLEGHKNMSILKSKMKYYKR